MYIYIMFLLFFAKASLTLSRVADRSSLTGGTVIARVPSCQGIRNHQKPSEIIRVYHCTKYSCFKHLQTELAELLAFVWFFVCFCRIVSLFQAIPNQVEHWNRSAHLCTDASRIPWTHPSSAIQVPWSGFQLMQRCPLVPIPILLLYIVLCHCANCMYKSPAGAVKVMQASCELWDKEWARRRVLIHFSFGHLAYLGVHPYQLIENCEWQSHERTPAATTYIYI